MSKREEVEQLDLEERAEFARLAEEGGHDVNEMLGIVSDKYRDRYLHIVISPVSITEEHLGSNEKI